MMRLRSDDRRWWACGDRAYAPIHHFDGRAVPRFKDLKVRAACGTWLHPADIWSRDPGEAFLKHHGCKRCNALRKAVA